MNRLAFMLVTGAAALSVGMTAAVAAPVSANRLTGIIVAVHGRTIILQTRQGRVPVDLNEAMARSRVGVIAPHIAVEVYGTALADGTFHCVSTAHAAPTADSWEPDR